MLNKATIKLYIELTKPRIVALVCVTTIMGFYMAPGVHYIATLFATLFGTILASAGAAVLNHCVERDTDRLMERTRDRPIPAGKIPPLSAMLFGIVLVLTGVFWLKAVVNLLASFLVLLTAFLYVLVYTPLKKLTWLNTFIGAIPGALPPVVGWVAAAGEMGLGAYILFLILFAWQHPHFYALAWLFREDYARGGLKMLPVVDPSGTRTVFHVLLYSVILLVVSVLPVCFGMEGRVYFIGALVMGIGMLYAGIEFTRTKSDASARRLFRASIIYFPSLLSLMLVDGIL